jgi:hypothetical protein
LERVFAERIFAEGAFVKSIAADSAAHWAHAFATHLTSPSMAMVEVFDYGLAAGSSQ